MAAVIGQAVHHRNNGHYRKFIYMCTYIHKRKQDNYVTYTSLYFFTFKIYDFLNIKIKFKRITLNVRHLY